MSYYYPVTITAVRRELSCHEATDSVTHLYWMCDQIEGFDPYSLGAALKAARWIGWIFASMEQMKVWDNTVSRELARADSLFDFDRPYKELAA